MEREGVIEIGGGEGGIGGGEEEDGSIVGHKGEDRIAAVIFRREIPRLLFRFFMTC